MKYILYTLTLLIQSNLIAQSTASEKINIGEQINIFSNILNENRVINIYQPQGFWGLDEETENLPVIYVLDGESQFLNTVSTIDYLSSAPLGNDILPRAIIIGIPNTNRNRDLTPIKGMLANDSTMLQITGGGPKFLEFITSELIPYIDKNYSTCDNRTIIGHSLGGLITFDALLRKRAYFDNYVAIDPALGFANNAYFEEILDTLSSSDLSTENLFVAAGNNRPTFLNLEELQEDTSDFMTLIDKPNFDFFNHKDSKDWQINLSTQYYPDENHFSVPYRATYDAMKYFFRFYSFKEMGDYYHPAYGHKNDLVPLIKKHYQQISEKMGCKFIPMEGYLNSFAFGLSHAGRHDLAVDLFNYNTELYPNRPTVYNSFGYYYRNNDDRKEAIKQFDKSLKLKNDEDILEVRNQIYEEMTEDNKR